MSILEAESMLELDVIFEFDITQFRPGCNYLPNGDPGYPDEGGEEELTDANVVFYDEKAKKSVTFPIPKEWIPYLASQIDSALERELDKRGY
jgi:hypothetical protein